MKVKVPALVFCPASVLTDGPVSGAARNTCGAQISIAHALCPCLQQLFVVLALLLWRRVLGTVEAAPRDSSHSGKLKLDLVASQCPPTQRKQIKMESGEVGGVKLASTCTCLGGTLISFLSALRRKRQSPNETPRHFPRR